MRKLLFGLGLLGLLLLPALLLAQPPTAIPGNSFSFEQAAPDLATANSYTYRIYADGATTGSVFAVKCTGTVSPFTCVGPVPAFTPGTHSITMTAGNVAGESAKSAPFSFQMVIQPAAPTNLRIL